MSQRVHHLIENMGNAKRINRQRAATSILQHPKDFPNLLKIALNASYKWHHKAAWVLELVLEEQLDWLLPHIALFTKKIHLLQNDSAIRPMAKICRWLAEEYVRKQNPNYIKTLTTKHLERIVSAGFDWMIGDYKVATQACTMDTLYYISCLPHKKFEWIRRELKDIILKNLFTGSPGYKNHGKKIITLIESKHKIS